VCVLTVQSVSPSRLSSASDGSSASSVSAAVSAGVSVSSQHGSSWCVKRQQVCQSVTFDAV